MLGTIFRSSYFVPFQKDSLWYTAVLNTTLNYVHCVIIQVIVDSAFTDTVVLVWVFNYWFFEVSFEL